MVQYKDIEMEVGTLLNYRSSFIWYFDINIGISDGNYGEDPPQSSSSSKDSEIKISESVGKAIQRNASQDNENLF